MEGGAAPPRDNIAVRAGSLAAVSAAITLLGEIYLATNPLGMDAPSTPEEIKKKAAPLCRDLLDFCDFAGLDPATVLRRAGQKFDLGSIGDEPVDAALRLVEAGMSRRDRRRLAKPIENAVNAAPGGRGEALAMRLRAGDQQ